MKSAKSKAIGKAKGGYKEQKYNHLEGQERNRIEMSNAQKRNISKAEYKKNSDAQQAMIHEFKTRLS